MPAQTRDTFICYPRCVVKRFNKLRKRIKLIVGITLLLNSCFLLQLYANFWVYPHTYLGVKNISGKTARDIDVYIDELVHKPYELHVQLRSYTYSLSDLGVVIDANQLKSRIFAPNTESFPRNIMALVTSLFTSRSIDIPLVFTQDFNTFIRESVYDFTEQPDDIVFDQSAKTLLYMENEEKYRIDESSLKTLLTSRVGNNTSTPLYPQLIKIQNERASVIANTGERIKNIFLEPLSVYVDASGNIKSFYLSENELIQMIDVQLTQDPTSVAIGLHEDVVRRLINDHVHKLGFLPRDNVVTPKVLEDVQDVLRGRFAGHAIEAISVVLDSGPNTTGTNAAKYIEVDISQQKMYLFKNGKLIKTYRVSTGLEYPTPTGEFKILNKVGLGYSNIYNVWMPYWMGFKYSESLGAYFGIHELPYTLAGDKKMQRPGDSIGSPNTGGCVALGVGSAREVYQFADIGTMVVIYP